MKTLGSPFIHVAALAALFLAAAPAALAAVISHRLNLTTSDAPAGSAVVEPLDGVPTGWNMYLQATNNGGIQIANMTLGMTYAWFRVEEGMAVDPALLLGNRPYGPRGPFSAQIGDDFHPAELGGSLLFGYWVNRHGSGYDAQEGDTFGWVRLVNRNGRIVKLDDAVDLNGPGVFAGTLQSVPEPGAVSLLMGTLFLSGRRRRREKRA